MTKLAWGSKVSPEFRVRVLHAAVRLGIDPNWLMAIMAFETGHTFDPAIWNKVNHKYVGLIQFGDAAAADLNTSTAALAAMSPVEQLDYVERYFNRYIGRIKTLSDAYMAVLWPRAVGQPEDTVLFPPGSQAYLQNRGLDIDHNGAVTKAEATSYVVKALNAGQDFATTIEVDIAAEEESETTTEPEVIEDEVIQIPAAEEPMATDQTFSGIASIASLFNPLIGGLISAFSPLLQSKLEKTIKKNTGDPTQSAEIADALSKLLLGQARAFTGQSNDFRAISAIVGDPAQAENKAKIEKALDTELDVITKAGDKATTWDQAMWAADIAGKQAVSTIAIEEKRAGLWDMTQTLVMFAGGMSAAMVLLITLAIIYQSVWGEYGIDVGLIGLGGPLLMAAIQCWSGVFAYRFDGTKQSTDQSKVLVNAAKRK